jgi:Uma2 family endonuclease
MTVTAAKFTVEDHHHLIETGILEGRPVELLQGLIVEMSPEDPIHVNRIDEIAEWFRRRIVESVRVQEAHPITLSDSEPEPDVALVVNQNYPDHHPYPEDIFLIIEVAHSSLGKDLNEKVAAYARAGITEYWLVDLLNGRVIAMRQPQGGGYQSTQELTTGEIFPLHFPNLSVPVTVLLGN